jgi:hypothetical protein
MLSRPELPVEERPQTEPDRWFTVIFAACAFAGLTTCLASWLPVSDASLSRLQIPVSVLGSIVGGVLGYKSSYRTSRRR